MPTVQDQESQTAKLPESIADIIRKNPLFQQSPADSGGSSIPVADTDMEKKKISPEKAGTDEASQADDDDDKDDYFISKPVNSAFEINIAEFPIAYLNRGQLPAGISKTEYQYKDTIKGRDGKPVERIWTIEAHATDEIKDENGERNRVQLGFGGPATLEVIYELFQLWKEQGFKEPRIHIGTFYNLLQRLGWGKGNSQYKQLRRVLNCIHGLHIKGESCFYLPELDKYENVDFYPFYRIKTYTKEEKKLNPDDYVFVCVDDEFFNAVKSNTVYYLPLDRFYFKTLKPMEQKLALMLSKVFSPYRKKQRFEWRRNIYELANQIPILSEESIRIRQQLKRICEGLIQKKFPFLSSYKIDGDVIAFYNTMQTSLNLLSDGSKTEKKDYDTVEWLIKEQLKICGDEHSRAFYALVARYVPVDLIYQALSEAKQEGKVKRKLYTKIILEKGHKYLAPYLKNARKTEDAVIIPDEEAKRIKLELEKEKEDFEQHKKSLTESNPLAEDNNADEV
ncbi:MAG: hypothetical protein PHC61_00685 [Chitinivibrionales bacterium]|nr:hypothetical protein [Chitinivibrionales bacterium]